MAKKSALGKGLGALIPEKSNQEPLKESVTNISMNLIRADKNQPRKTFDENKILELSQSIKEHGVIQPIILKKANDGNYIIVAGERRWRACKQLGIKEIPAIIKELSDEQVLEISLIENIVREDLNPIEEALAYKRLMNQFNLTQEEISKKICKSRSAIANCLRLLNLDERVQQYVIEGVISEGHGRAILAISDNNTQYEIAQKIIDDQLNVRETEALIKNILNDQQSKVEKSKKEKNPYYKDVEKKLENYFDTKVNINSKSKNKGRIEIEYYSEDELQRILELLNL